MSMLEHRLTIISASINWPFAPPTVYSAKFKRRLLDNNPSPYFVTWSTACHAECSRQSSQHTQSSSVFRPTKQFRIVTNIVFALAYFVFLSFSLVIILPLCEGDTVFAQVQLSVPHSFLNFAITDFIPHRSLCFFLLFTEIFESPRQSAVPPVLCPENPQQRSPGLVTSNPGRNWAIENSLLGALTHALPIVFVQRWMTLTLCSHFFLLASTIFTNCIQALLLSMSKYSMRPGIPIDSFFTTQVLQVCPLNIHLRLLLSSVLPFRLESATSPA